MLGADDGMDVDAGVRYEVALIDLLLDVLHVAGGGIGTGV